jgi:hypothetical protein
MVGQVGSNLPINTLFDTSYLLGATRVAVESEAAAQRSSSLLLHTCDGPSNHS